MTDRRRQKTGGRPEAEGGRRTYGLPPTAYSLLALCLCILALRVTYTESPTAQMLVTPGSLFDTVYGLTLSGLLIFAFVLWLLWRIFSNRPAYRVTGMEIGLAMFGAAAVISALHASDKRAAVNQVMVLLGPIFAALLLAQILDGPHKVRVVLTVAVALGIVSAYQCAEQFFISNAITIEQYEKSPEMLLEPLGIETGTFQHFLFEHRLYSRGIRGFFTTSNSAASYAILACAAVAVLLIHRLRDGETHETEPRYGWFAPLAAGLVVAGLFLTQSKGGILAFFAGLAICGVLVTIHRRFPGRTRRVLKVLVATVLLLVIAGGCAMVFYGLKHGRLPGGNSMLVRWQYWAASVRMYADHPLTGVGPGNFSDYYTHYKPAPALESVADPHNFLLSLLTQYGPLGLLGFLMMVSVPLWRSLAPPASEPPVGDPAVQPSFKRLALIMLSAVCVCLLAIRPQLIPSAADDLDGLLYDIVTMYVAPAAAFLIGFLLVAAPLENGRRWRLGFTGAPALVVLGSAILAVLLHNLIDFALFEPGVWMAFWTIVACLIAMGFQRHTARSITPCNLRGLKPLASAIAIVLVGSYCLYVWKPVYNATAGIQQAQSAASAGRFDAAHRHLEAAARADSFSPVAPNYNGRLYLQQYEQTPEKQPGLLEEAARCFRQAIERNPADYKDQERLATVYGRLGQWQKAYDAYMRAAELYPGRERLWFELAQTAERLNRLDAALAHYTTTVEIEDSYRQQFRAMYPKRDKVVSRLGEKEYQHAKKRIGELAGRHNEGSGP